MKDIIIKVNSQTHKVDFPDEFLGIGYENLQGNLIFECDNNFIGGVARLEANINGNIGAINDLQQYGNGYIVPIKSSLLTGSNVLMQLVVDQINLTKYILTTDTTINPNKTYFVKEDNTYIVVENPVVADISTYYEAQIPTFKTDIFLLKVRDSINAEATIPDEYPTWVNILNTLIGTINNKLNLVDEALIEMNNLNINVSDKVDGKITITFTDKEGNTKEVEIKDGRGIVSIIKTETSGNIDTYTITYTDNTTSTFQVTNGIDGTDGVGIESIYLTGTSGLIDTYTILYTDGTTTEFQVKNGRGITKIEKISTDLLVDTYKITFNDGTTQNYEITNGKGIVSIEKSSTSGLTDIYTITYNDNTTTTFNVVNGKGIVSIEKTSTVGYVDTYTITYNDGTTTTYEVTNGEVSQAQFDALQSELDYYKTIVNALPKITGTATYITLNNTADSILKVDLEASNMTQETTTGIQLFNNNKNSYTYHGITVTNNGDGSFTFNGTNDYGSSLGYYLTVNESSTTPILNLEDGTYLLKIYHLGGTVNLNNANLDLLVGVLNDDNSAASAYMGISINNNQTYNTKEFASKRWTIMDLYVRAGQSFNNYTFKVLFGKTSNTDIEWEPYTGSIPAPNPDYPQTIHTISGDNSVKVENKNFFNYYDLANKIETFTITGNPKEFTVSINSSGTYQYLLPLNGQYKISGSWSTTRLDGDVKLIYDDDSNTNLLTNYGATSGSGTINVTSNVSKNIKAIQFRTFGASNITITDFQIESGDTKTDYVPHQEQVVTIPLGDLEYCEMPNTDYEDEFYLATSSDTGLTAGKWYLKKNINKVVFTGADSEAWSVGQAFGYYRAIIPVNNILGYSDTSRHIDRFMCSHFTPSTDDAIGKAFQYQKQLFFYIPSGITNSSDWKIWLSTHNTTVYYVLETPTYTLLNDTLQNALNTLQEKLLAYKTQTNISQVNNDVAFTISASALKDISNL